MAKKACEKKEYSPPENPLFRCKKCDRLVTSENKVCKPRKLKG